MSMRERLVVSTQPALLLAAAAGTYGALFPLAHQFVGAAATTLALIPVATAAWVLGAGAGVAAALLSAVVNVALLTLSGTHGLTPIIQNVIPVFAGMAYLAGTIGWLRRGHFRAQQLEAERRELELVSNAKAEFLSTVSHELRTPLASILGFADILSRNRAGNLSGHQVEQIELIRRNGRRLAVLINDLVDLSAIEADRFDIAPAEFDARELIRAVATEFGPTADARQQTLAVRVPLEPTWMTADRSRMAQVLTHLLSNASKYSPPGSQIDLEADVNVGRLEVAVRDRGIGISLADQRRIFTPFFRAKNEETRSVAGTGLGLAISRRIVELHGGTISFESAEGAGTTMRVQIPGIVNRQVIELGSHVVGDDVDRRQLTADRLAA
jgi:signal transduction histidine kinase